MLIKPKVMPADPTKVCRACSHHDPDLHVCCANDYAIRDEEAKTMSCSDWDPKKICITCGYFDPDTNQCWFEEHDMSEEESLTRTCETWEPRKEVPLQPDGSLKMQARETIGCHIVNGDGITWATLRTRHCGNCLHQVGDEMCPDPGEPSKEGCKNWEPKEEHADTLLEICKMQQEKQPVFGGTSLNELEAKTKVWGHQQEAKALDRGAKQGMTLEALDTVFAIACQQVPSMEKRWMELKAEINIMFAQKWATEDMPE